MHAKITADGQLQVAPKRLKIDIVNPSVERLEFEGYKEVIETPCPECDEEHEAVSHYEEQDGKIVQVWEIVERKEVEPSKTEQSPEMHHEGALVI